jgi:hypothetical protein
MSRGTWPSLQLSPFWVSTFPGHTGNWDREVAMSFFLIILETLVSHYSGKAFVAFPLFIASVTSLVPTVKKHSLASGRCPHQIQSCLIVSENLRGFFS